MQQRNSHMSREQKDVEISTQPLLSSSSNMSSTPSLSTQYPIHRSQKKYMYSVPPPFYTTIAAVVMLSMGSVFLGLGLASICRGEGYDLGRNISVLILGSILFIPGSYSSFILYGSWVGWNGFSYDQVPSYDD